MFDMTMLTTMDTSPSNGIVRSRFIFRIIIVHHIPFSLRLIISVYSRKMSDYLVTYCRKMSDYLVTYCRKMSGYLVTYCRKRVII
jgi:hypothetical protein